MQKLHEHIGLLTMVHETNKTKRMSIWLWSATAYMCMCMCMCMWTFKQEQYIFCLSNSLLASQATVSTVLDRQSLLLERTRLSGRHSDRCPLSAVQETLVRITVFKSRGRAVSTVPLVCPKSMQRRLTAIASHALSAHTGCQSPAVYTSTIPALPPLSVSRTSPSLWSTEWNHNSIMTSVTNVTIILFACAVIFT